MTLSINNHPNFASQTSFMQCGQAQEEEFDYDKKINKKIKNNKKSTINETSQGTE
jgi:hypothetical protein